MLKVQKGIWKPISGLFNFHIMVNKCRVFHVISMVHKKVWCRQNKVSIRTITPMTKSNIAILLTICDHIVNLNNNITIMQIVKDFVIKFVVT